MVHHIQCPECREDIAEISQAYEIFKNSYIDSIIAENNQFIDIDKIDLKTDILNNFEFIFRALEINKQCCRIHMLGNTDFDSLYY